MKGKLIVFEGMDKTGKSSTSEALFAKLKEKGEDVILVRQPGDPSYSYMASFVRSLATDKRAEFTDLSRFYLFLIDRIELCSKVIKPALEQGKTVICDRWHWSTIVYQIYADKLAEKIGLDESYFSIVTEKTILKKDPDITLFFSGRIDDNRNDSENDLYDNSTEVFSIEHAYDMLAEKEKWFKVERQGNPNATAEYLIKVLEGL